MTEQEVGEVRNYKCDTCDSTTAVYSNTNKAIICFRCGTAMTFVGSRTYVRRRPKNKLDFE